ncbi:MAG: MraY family glycosyltransferase [bacterium]
MIDSGIQLFLLKQLPAAVVAFLLCILFSPLYAKLARHVGLVDRPSGRKKHAGAIPRIGGAVLVDSFIVCLLVFGGLNLLPLWAWVGLLIFVLTGLLDDLFDIGPWQIVGQVAGVFCAAMGGVVVSFFNNPLTGEMVFTGVWGIGIAMFWMLLLVNAINWADGMDGLATGITMIGALFLCILSVKVGHFETAQLGILFVFLLLGFLFHNFPPAKLFLGTIGVNFLGYMFGVLSISGGAKVAASFLVLSLPILDVGITIGRRILQGKKIYKPDRQHLFLILVDSGMPVKRILLLFYSLTVLLGFAALSENAIQKISTIVLSFFILIALHIWAERRKITASDSTLNG